MRTYLLIVFIATNLYYISSASDFLEGEVLDESLSYLSAWLLSSSFSFWFFLTYINPARVITAGYLRTFAKSLYPPSLKANCSFFILIGFLLALSAFLISQSPWYLSREGLNASLSALGRTLIIVVCSIAGRSVPKPSLKLFLSLFIIMVAMIDGSRTFLLLSISFLYQSERVSLRSLFVYGGIILTLLSLVHFVRILHSESIESNQILVEIFQAGFQGERYWGSSGLWSQLSAQVFTPPVLHLAPFWDLFLAPIQFIMKYLTVPLPSNWIEALDKHVIELLGADEYYAMGGYYIASSFLSPSPILGGILCSSYVFLVLNIFNRIFGGSILPSCAFLVICLKASPFVSASMLSALVFVSLVLRMSFRLLTTSRLAL
jgi:hypothetical protein